MISFKKWLHNEAAFPNPIIAHGKKVGSEEEFDDVTGKHFKQKYGYDDNQLKQIKKDVDVDYLWNPKFAPKNTWFPETDPNFANVEKIISKLIPIISHRKEFYLVIEKDPIARTLFRNLLKNNPNEEDVENFINQIKNIDVYKPSDDIEPPEDKTINYRKNVFQRLKKHTPKNRPPTTPD